MTVESLIKSAIADEVEAKLDPKVVKEIVDKKVQRLAKKVFDKKDISLIVAHEVGEYLNSWDGKRLVCSVIAKSILKNFDNVRIGDRVKLPAFTVPAVKMDGEDVLAFDEKYINADEAIVIGKEENGDLILIFDHCLFESAIDLNNEKRFEMTQLGQYLQSEFLRAMNGAGIPAESCGLISKEEMFGDNALDYFKTGRNRIAFDFDEDYSRYYWLSTLHDEDASAAYFCLANNLGYASYYSARDAYYCVRPRFIISAI